MARLSKHPPRDEEIMTAFRVESESPVELVEVVVVVVVVFLPLAFMSVGRHGWKLKHVIPVVVE
jgi:hypothetical protein